MKKNNKLIIIIFLLILSISFIIYKNVLKPSTNSEEKVNSQEPDKTETEKKEEKIELKENQTLTKKGYILEENDGVYSIDGIIIVNKTYSIPQSYGNGLTKEFTEAFNKMQVAAKEDNIDIKIISGYRSYNTQVSTYNHWTSKYGKEEADKISARPGHSEHQLGLAADINSLYTSFKDTKEGIWLNNNAYKYGFILRYPESKTEETGYSFEPWHYRYVGTSLAEKLHNNGDWITLEDYYGITSKYE